MRNTPTCVGKTLSARNARKPPQKHPHMRGEDQNVRFFLIALGRNTPTCVGKTL